MSIRKKGSRWIVADGVPYRWRVRHRTTNDGYGESLAFAAQRDDEPGRILHVTMPQGRYDSAYGCLSPPPAPLTPSAVAESIRRAVRAGWDAAALGNSFFVRRDERH